MKVRFYCDVPEYISGHQPALSAWTHQIAYTVSPGYKRVAFDVDLPCKDFDEQARAQNVVVEQHG